MVGPPPPMYLPFLAFSCVQVTWLQIYTATVASDCKGSDCRSKQPNQKNQKKQNSRTFWIIDSSRRIVCLFCFDFFGLFLLVFFVFFLVWCFWLIIFGFCFFYVFVVLAFYICDQLVCMTRARTGSIVNMRRLSHSRQFCCVSCLLLPTLMSLADKAHSSPSTV